MHSQRGIWKISYIYMRTIMRYMENCEKRPNYPKGNILIISIWNLEKRFNKKNDTRCKCAPGVHRAHIAIGALKISSASLSYKNHVKQKIV